MGGIPWGSSLTVATVTRQRYDGNIASGAKTRKDEVLVHSQYYSPLVVTVEFFEGDSFYRPEVVFVEVFKAVAYTIMWLGILSEKKVSPIRHISLVKNMVFKPRLWLKTAMCHQKHTVHSSHRYLSRALFAVYEIRSSRLPIHFSTLSLSFVGALFNHSLISL